MQKITFALLADCPSSHPLVADWLRSAWPDWYGTNGSGDANDDVRHYSQRDALPLGLLAFVGEQPCGFGALKVDNVPGMAHVSPWLGAGYVVPARRGQGLGAALIRALEDQARRLGFAQACCATATASSLLIRAGWTHSGEAELGGQRVAIFQRLL